MMTKQTLSDFLESQDFYELMQVYRHEPADAAKPFEAVKTALIVFSQSWPLPAPVCSTHPGAPHGFDRNMSHSLDRYVCDCEGWIPDNKAVKVEPAQPGSKA